MLQGLGHLRPLAGSLPAFIPDIMTKGRVDLDPERRALQDGIEICLALQDETSLAELIKRAGDGFNEHAEAQ